MPAKRTEPSRSALIPAHNFKYTNANDTNLAKRFADMRRAAAKAEREAAAEQALQAQTTLELGASSVTVLPVRRKAAC
jgi:hypothetical protein